MAYTKLFAHIITSTIWDEDDQTRILWITMLALSNKFGEVMASVPGLAHTARLSAEATRRALACLEAPDPDSRTPDEEGRRVFKIDGGWHIINYEKHRRMASLDERREQARIRKQRERKRKKTAPERSDVTLDVTKSHTRSRSVTVFDDNAEAEAEVQRGTAGTSVPKSGSYPESTKRPKNNPIVPFSRSPRRQASDDAYTSEFEKFWEEFPHRKHKRVAFKAWKKALERGISPETMIEGIKVYEASEREKWNKYENYSPLHPATWINADGWEDESAMKIHRKPTKYYAEENHDYLS